MKRLTVFLVIVIAVLLGLGAMLILGWAQDIDAEVAAGAQFAASDEDQAGVAISSTFRLTFASPVSSASVTSALSVEPQIALGIHQGSSRQEVLLVPAEPLAEGTCYTFTLQDGDGHAYTWAVETKQPAAISSVFPADRQTEVALDAVLRIVLDKGLSLDLERLAEAVTITPAVAGVFAQSGRLLTFTPTSGWQPDQVYQVEVSQALPFTQATLSLNAAASWCFETTGGSAEPWTLSGSASFLPQDTVSFLLTGMSSDNPAMIASLYQFADAEAYAQTLCAVSWERPVWSRSFTCMGGLDVSGLTARGLQETAAVSADKLVLRANPGPGYYLLRVSVGSSVRDALFAVSPLSVYTLTDSGRTLLWIYDGIANQPLKADVADLLGGASGAAGADGLLTLANNGAAVYVITQGQNSLVLPLWENRAEPAQLNQTWRYLYTDKTVYENGDTLRFYGLLLPRDGSELTYERVSVYLLPAGEEDLSRCLYKGYAPLDDHLFSGQISLPELPAGSYQLQVWQSGQLYLTSDFSIPGAAEMPSASSPALSAETLSLQLGEKYQADFRLDQQDQGDYLYLTASGGLQQAVCGQDGVYDGVFLPQDGLSQYILSVCRGPEGFFIAGLKLLTLDCASRQLSFGFTSSTVLEAGTAVPVQVTLTDSQGQPLADVPVLLQILAEDVTPAVDTGAAIFSDYSPAGLSLRLEAPRRGVPRGGETLLWQVCRTDESGQAVASLQLEHSGNLYVIAQALTVEDGQVYAASMVKKLYYKYSGSQTQLTPDGVIEPGVGHKEAAWFSDVAAAAVWRENVFAVLVADSFRMSQMKTLSKLAFTQTPPEFCLDAMAVSLARQRLSIYCGADLSTLFSWPQSDAGVYQKDNGGIGSLSGSADLSLSAFTALLQPEGIAYGALRDYFLAQLEQGVTGLAQAQCLAALAALDYPTLAELRGLLAAEVEGEETFLWLTLGLAFSGDTRSAELYLAGQAGDAAAFPLLQALNATCLGQAAAAQSYLAQTGELEVNSAAVFVACRLLDQAPEQENSLTYQDGEQDYHIRVNSVGLIRPGGKRLTVLTADSDLRYLSFYLQ